MKIVITGATGFIGTPLCAHLRATGHEIVALTRDTQSARQSLGGTATPVEWDGRKVGDWARHVDGAGAVINLAGAGIADKRWTEARKRQIRASRVDATTAVVEAIRHAQRKPAVLINGSAIGYYGPRGDEPLDEHAPAGDDFLATVCKEWERAARPAEQLCRLVLLRTGVVLGPNGGALAKMLTPFKLFVGGPLGSGRQQFSWIHRRDEIGLIEHALATEAIAGPMNATAPAPVTLREFCKTLGRAMGRPSWAPVPAPVLKAVLGEMSDMLLTGQRVIPKLALDTGYTFQFPTAEPALRDVLARA